MADGLFNPSRLYDALKQYGLLPKHANYSPAGDAQGLFNSQINRVVAPDASLVGRDKYAVDSTMATLAHEMTHSVQSNLLLNTAMQIQYKKQRGEKLTDQEQQYLRASEQMFADQFGNVGSFDRRKFLQDTGSYKSMTKSMYSSPKGDKDFERYRTSPNEAQAFGVGNMSYSSDLSRPGQNPHFDPSMAQEFDILLSMYQNLPESLKSSAASTKKTQIEKNREKSDDYYLQTAKDLFKNPFEPTIK
jgi:hypothetical protein